MVDALNGAQVWGVCLRCLGLMHLIQYLSLRIQIPGLIGPDGILPIKESLTAEREEHGLFRGILRIPTLFWISGNNAMISFVVNAGIFFSMLLILGVYSQLSTFFLYILYLSLTNGGGNFIMFPWDFLLTEMTLLFSLLPPLFPIAYSLSMELMLGFGIEKFWFMDEATAQGIYIKKFLEWQPHPTPAAWYVSKFPIWSHVASEVGLWVVELVLPWMVFFCMGHRPTEIFVFVCLLGLQVGIQICGNFGIFNILSTVLAGTLLAPSPTWDEAISEFWRNPLLAAIVLLQAFCGIFFLLHQLEPFGVLAANWSGWIFNEEEPALWGRVLPPWFLNFQKFVCRFHIAHGWGVFRHTYPCTSLTVEGSNDVITWTPYKFKVYHQPKWVAPHQPRLDYMMRYESGRLSFSLPVVSGIVTYWGKEGRMMLPVKLLRAICAGKKPVLELFKENPFPDAPPKFARMALFNSKYTRKSLSNTRQSHEYWKNDLTEFRCLVSQDPFQAEAKKKTK